MLELIVCRPSEDERTALGIGELTPQDGLVGDNWRARGSWKKEDQPADVDVQLTLMNARCFRRHSIVSIGESPAGISSLTNTPKISPLVVMISSPIMINSGSIACA